MYAEKWDLESIKKVMTSLFDEKMKIEDQLRCLGDVYGIKTCPYYIGQIIDSMRYPTKKMMVVSIGGNYWIASKLEKVTWNAECRYLKKNDSIGKRKDYISQEHFDEEISEWRSF